MLAPVIMRRFEDRKDTSSTIDTASVVLSLVECSRTQHINGQCEKFHLILYCPSSRPSVQTWSCDSYSNSNNCTLSDCFLIHEISRSLSSTHLICSPRVRNRRKGYLRVHEPSTRRRLRPPRATKGNFPDALFPPGRPSSPAGSTPPRTGPSAVLREPPNTTAASR